MAPEPAAKSPRALRDVADLLRHLERPQRLRRNALALSLIDCEDDWHGRLQAAVAAVVGGLPARQREIVERCDFASERHAEVARSLSISERHFYRERCRALSAIATALHRFARAEPSALRDVSLTSVVTRLEIALDHAAALAQTGSGALAASVLEGVAATVTAPDERVLVACRLAELHVNLANVSSARAWSLRAVEASVHVSREAAWLADEAAIARAESLRLEGDEVAAGALAQESLTRLRAACVTTPCARVREAFAAAAMLVAERAIEAGARPVATRLCDEARAMLDVDPRTRTIVRLRVARHLAVGKLFEPHRVDEGVAALGTLVQRQLAAGLLAEACQTATTLAATHRVLNRPEAAAATLAPLLDVARSACAGEALAGALLEFAWTLVPSETAEAPWDVLVELRRHAPPGSLVHALSFLVEAAALLSRDEPLPALRASHAAIEALSVLRRWRYVGMALRTEALALEALGDLDGARLIITASLERLEGKAHPAFVSRARSDARRLFGTAS